MDKTFRIHYQRKADGQDFHERMTMERLRELLARGGIILCGITPDDEK